MPVDDEATAEIRTFYANLAERYRKMTDEEFAKLPVRTPDGRSSTAGAEGMSRKEFVKNYDHLAKTVVRTYEEDVG